MSISAGLRLTARRINSGQARPIVGARDARHFSHSTSITRSSRRPELHSTRLSSIPQTRSLSLFGWGSNKSSDDFTQTHSQPTKTPDTSVSAPSLESTRTVKATHSTSDAPDPATVSNIEADPLQHIENSVLQSQNVVANDTPDLASIPEGLGYLKDVCGLDFGWGPTSVMQFALEHLHITAGLSWTASIIAISILLRASIFPLAFTASDVAARFQEYSPLLKEMTTKQKEAMANNDRTGVLEAQMQIRELKKEGKFSFNKMFRPMLLQIPFGYGVWHLMRNCSDLPVPGFENETFLWLSSLAVGDPWYILPAATAAMTWLNFSSSTKTQAATAEAMPGMTLVKNLLPGVTGIFLLFQPACVQIYFLTSGILQQLQLTCFNNAGFRRFFKMHPQANRNPTPGYTGPSHMNATPKFVNTTARTVSTSSSTQTPTSNATRGPVSERSLIDRGVDAIKSSSQQAWRKASGNTMEKVAEKQATQKRQSQKDAARRYEAQRKQDLESRRTYRNATQSSQNEYRKR